MEDSRLIEIEEDIEDEFEDEEDYDDEEFAEELIPEGIMSPRGSNFINTEEEDDEEEDDVDDDEEEEEEEEEDEYEDEDEEDYEETDELIPVEMASPRVSNSTSDGRTLQGAVVINEGSLDDSDDSESREGKSNKENGGEGELNRGDIDGLFCPICFEPWTNCGEHRICCLPCGHLYGLSCIKKWLQRCRNSGKCPQCNGLCTLKDVRILYATRLCVAEAELYKRMRSLEAKSDVFKAEIEKRMQSIEAKSADFEKRMRSHEVECAASSAELQKRMRSFEANFAVADAELQKRLRSLEAKCAYLEQKVSSQASPLTPEELVNQISNNPMLVRRLATALAELNQQQDSS